ncbi:MAG: sigma 54-interacting transcriptional regulator [Candidatus Deferrimicrobiaceae bacterium]
MDTPSVRGPESAEKRLDFEVLISDLSARFVNIPAGQVDREIEEALGRLLVFFDVDRCGLIEVLQDLGEAHITHVALKDGIPSVPMATDLIRLYPWSATRLIRDAEVINLHTRDYPPEAVVDRASNEAMKTRTNLSIPLLYGGTVRYLIAITAVREERIWPAEYISRFRLVGEIFVNALMRERADRELQRSLEEVRALKDRLVVETENLRREVLEAMPRGGIVGQSAAIRGVLALVGQVAPRDTTVLITGDTGTGKELIARAIHDISPRRNQVMVKVNCAGLPPSLVESELFGREKGAYTGAFTPQAGRFEIADGSTLFLDEIGDLTPDNQVKLLRVLQEGEFERLGSSKTIRVDVRVIAATNRDLEKDVRDGTFRKDLFYRLNVFPIAIPPLRERPGDIPMLVWYFLQEFEDKMGIRIRKVPKGVMEALVRYPWPGNIRELHSVVERGVITSGGDTLRLQLPKVPGGRDAGASTLADAERRLILATLERTGGRVKGARGAADLLGINPSTLYSRMRKAGISPRREKDDITP